MYNKMTLNDVNLGGKRVLCRVDFNVPIADGQVSDDSRIVAALKTVQHILQQGGKLILASHLGRPKGKVDAKYTLAPIARRLGELLGREVPLAPDCIGPEVQKMVDALKNGDVLLLENVRFHAEEELNDPAFSRELAKLADAYVNDAFGTAHRAHASTEGVAHLLNPAVAGFLMEDEIRYLGQALTEPARPFVAILGGAKAKDKIPVIHNLIKKVDMLLIGGGMAYTFLKAEGLEVGRSLVQEDQIELARDLLLGFGGRRGLGFLREATREELTAVPGINPISRNLRRKAPSPPTAQITPLSPIAKSFKVIFSLFFD